MLVEVVGRTCLTDRILTAVPRWPIPSVLGLGAHERGPRRPLPARALGARVPRDYFALNGRRRKPPQTM